VHTLTKTQARRIAVKAQLLDAPRPTDLLEVVRRLTFLQIDPTAAIAPSADLVAWSRLGSSYQPEHLTKALEEERTLFESNALIRPMSDVGLYLAVTGGRRTHPAVQAWLRDNDRFRRDVLRLLERQGPVASRDIPDTCAVPWESTGWTNNRNVTQMLEFLQSRARWRSRAGSGESDCGVCRNASIRPTSRLRRSRRRRGSGVSVGSLPSASRDRRRGRCRLSRSTWAKRASRPLSRA
jgi:uncharacterized protein YcaQ